MKKSEMILSPVMSVGAVFIGMGINRTFGNEAGRNVNIIITVALLFVNLYLYIAKRYKEAIGITFLSIPIVIMTVGFAIDNLVIMLLGLASLFIDVFFMLKFLKPWVDRKFDK